MNDVGKQEHKEKKAAVILAAGSGRRMNTPVAKQFLDLMGIPVFLHSVRLFDKIADKIVLVTSLYLLTALLQHRFHVFLLKQLIFQ